MSTPVHPRHSQLPPLMRRKESWAATPYDMQPTIPALLNFLQPNPTSRSRRSTSPSPSLPSLYLASSPSSSCTHFQASSPPPTLPSTPPDSPSMHRTFVLDKPVQRPKDERGLYLLLSVLESTQPQFQPKYECGPRPIPYDLYADEVLPISAHPLQLPPAINSTVVPCTPLLRTPISLPQTSSSPPPHPTTPSPHATSDYEDTMDDDDETKRVSQPPPSPCALWAPPLVPLAVTSPSRAVVLPEECGSPTLTRTRDISPPPAFVTSKTERCEECQPQPLSSPAYDDVIAPVAPIINEDGPKSFSTPIEAIPDRGIIPPSEFTTAVVSSPPAPSSSCAAPASPMTPAPVLLGPKTNKLDPAAESRPNAPSSPPSINAVTSSSTVRRSGPTATEANKRKRQRRVSDVENINYAGSSVLGRAAGSPFPSTGSVSLSDEAPTKKRVRRETIIKRKLGSPSTLTSATSMPVEKTVEPGMKKTHSGTEKRARKVKEQSSSSTEAPPEATASSLPSSSLAGDPCVGLDLPSLLVDTLIFGRVSFLSAPDLIKSLVRDQPHLLERQGVEAWTNLAREVLAKHKFFGRIARHGKDADGNKLEDAWYYESSFDPDRGRAETLAELAPPSSRRRKAKMGDRTYFYEPVDMNRWVVAAEEE